MFLILAQSVRYFTVTQGFLGKCEQVQLDRNGPDDRLHTVCDRMVAARLRRSVDSWERVRPR